MFFRIKKRDCEWATKTVERYCSLRRGLQVLGKFLAFAAHSRTHFAEIPTVVHGLGSILRSFVNKFKLNIFMPSWFVLDHREASYMKTISWTEAWIACWRSRSTRRIHSIAVSMVSSTSSIACMVVESAVDTALKQLRIFGDKLWYQIQISCTKSVGVLIWKSVESLISRDETRFMPCESEFFHKVPQQPPKTSVLWRNSQSRG